MVTQIRGHRATQTLDWASQSKKFEILRTDMKIVQMITIFAISLKKSIFFLALVWKMWYHIGVSDLLILLPIISCPFSSLSCHHGSTAPICTALCGL